MDHLLYIVTVPATGGWGNFQTIEGRVIAMSAGTYALSVESVDGGVNVDWYSFTLTDAARVSHHPLRVSWVLEWIMCSM
ncbi:MAG: hypothetical protein CM15mP51_21770 [Porticoccaceae bacterium]|nr:MAG: hypothetical protein CM15mP51_21770 [Porticoccaceae bacterium]